MITVRELIEVGGFDKNAVLTRDAFLDNTLSGVTSFDSPDGYRWLRPGEFVLTTGFPFVTQHETVESGFIRLIDALADIGTPGLSIKLGRYVDSLPDAVISHAVARKMPILTFPMEKAWSDVIVPVIRHISDKQRKELEQAHVIYERFHLHLTAGAPVSSITNLLTEVLQMPVSIHIPMMKWNWTSPAMAATDCRDEIDKLIGRMAPLSLLKQPVTTKHSGTCIRWLLHNQQVQGAIILQRLEDRELYAWEKVALEQAAALLVLEMERQRTVTETYQRFRNDFLQLLVSGECVTRDLWIRKAEEVGWELFDDYVALLLNVSSVCEPDVTTWKENSDMLKSLLPFLLEEVPSLLYGLDRDNRILLLVPASHDTGTHLNRLLSQMENALVRLNHSPLYMGVGRCHPGWAGISLSYREAAISLRSCLHSNKAYTTANCRSLLRRKDFGSLSLERILFADHPEAEANVMAEECLGQISHYDREKNGQLLLTLQTFLDANGNHAEAATRLFVHKNTIKYRLQLIRELTGMQPEDGQDQMLFRIALTVQSIGLHA